MILKRQKMEKKIRLAAEWNHKTWQNTYNYTPFKILHLLKFKLIFITLHGKTSRISITKVTGFITA